MPDLDVPALDNLKEKLNSFNGYYCGPRQCPSKKDHAQDALHQADCDINLCGSIVRRRKKMKVGKEKH